MKNVLIVLSALSLVSCKVRTSTERFQQIPDNPVTDATVALLVIAAGILLFLFRQPIGEFTGYYVGRGKIVDKPTPGCLLIPFAVALITGGTAMLVRVFMR